MQKIKALMEAGAYAEAARECRARLRRAPEDFEVKLLLGTCRRLLGDDREFERIDDELAALPAKRRPKGWRAYHALRAAALGTALVLASSLLPAGTVDGGVHVLYGIGEYTLYGGPEMCQTVRKAPKPDASDGTHSSCVKIVWKAVENASYYKIRRAPSADYSKSKVIATVYGTVYKDRDAACDPGRKYYYWVCPYNACGRGKKNADAFNRGYAKVRFDVLVPECLLFAGDRIQLGVDAGCAEIKPSACTWKITSGSSRATVSKKGVLTARKAGKVVVSVTYRGVTKKKSIVIGESLPVTKYGIASLRDAAVEYADQRAR